MIRNPLAPDLTHPDGGPQAPDVPLEVQLSVLELARATLAVAVEHADPSMLDRAVGGSDGADLHAAVFVTLTEGGELRGCIGTLDPTRSLREAVVSATLGAALGDPRFLPVTAAELPAIEVGISVLGRPVSLVDLDTFMPGVDGVIVERGGLAGAAPARGRDRVRVGRDRDARQRLPQGRPAGRRVARPADPPEFVPHDQVRRPGRADRGSRRSLRVDRPHRRA